MLYYIKDCLNHIDFSLPIWEHITLKNSTQADHIWIIFHFSHLFSVKKTSSIFFSVCLEVTSASNSLWPSLVPHTDFLISVLSKLTRWWSSGVDFLTAQMLKINHFPKKLLTFFERKKKKNPPCPRQELSLLTIEMPVSQKCCAHN